MYHINDQGEVRPCQAQSPESCKFYKGEDDTRHAETVEEASVQRDAIMKKLYGSLPKKKYSFVREFKRREEEFEQDFEGYPSRFFNADLTGKVYLPGIVRNEIDDVDPDELDGNVLRMVDYRALAARMFQSTSSTGDAGVSEETLTQSLKDLGADSIEPVHDAKTLRGLGAESAWRATFGDQQVAILGKRKGTNLSRYSFRRGTHEPFEPGSFTMTDVRTVMGAYRAERKTGVSLFPSIVGHDHRDGAEDARLASVRMLKNLHEAQMEGRNLIAQRKHLKEHSGSVATAWMDKKNPDKVHQEMMKKTKLNKVFRKVEIDNDVDPSEYADFEKAYDEVKDRLPPIPEDRRPELRIRKLGKHNATGIFFPHKNTIAVDVHDSSSFVHEYGHYIDLVVKDSESLDKEFQSITNAYSRQLKVPEAAGGKKRDYYTTPTEVHSRFFEVYAHERLGIDNRLVRAADFRNFDYAPIMENPELKEKAFAFFDKVFKK